VVIGGDGDLASIGGNHLIHAARRDVDLTVICANNGVYSMTGGQVTPTTPLGARTATTPAGNPDRPFDLCRLVEAAGATYVARYSVYQVPLLIRALKRALEHRGFAFVEVLSTCPTHYGRRNNLADPVAMLRDLRERCLTLRQAAKMSAEELREKIIVGEFT
jgi:2-oxoglutarate ferredoxin oxidoreductase subunit beta